MPNKTYSCFYCDEGVVESLPAKCPKCKHELKRELSELSTKELEEAICEKYNLDKKPVFMLAS